jgi:electron transfer flavoprotein beta subunit
LGIIKIFDHASKISNNANIERRSDLKIVVCVKQVPDSAAKLVAVDGKANWGDSPLVINPWDDSQMTSRVLSAAINKLGDVDLAFLGRQAIDTDTGLTAAQTAHLLGWPALTLVVVISNIDLSERMIKVERSAEEGRFTVNARLPAVLSIVKDFGEPRYPSFMGIRKASRAEIPVWSLADLALSDLKANIIWPEIMNPPQREITTEIITGDSPQEIAETLADKIMAEKIL